jgi:hypothetical protein
MRHVVIVAAAVVVFEFRRSLRIPEIYARASTMTGSPTA